MFGFAVSQSALELPSRQGHVEISHPFALFLYVATFALIVSLWLIFHRLMSGAYRPAGIDLFLAFAYLALVSLFPFALFDVSHAKQTLALARESVAQYSALYATMIAIAAVLNMRNLRRGYFVQDEIERDLTWRGFLRNASLAATMGTALATDLVFGPTKSSFVFPFILILMPLMRRLFPHAPSPAVLRLSPPGGSTLEDRPA